MTNVSLHGAKFRSGLRSLSVVSVLVLFGVLLALPVLVESASSSNIVTDTKTVSHKPDTLDLLKTQRTPAVTALKFLTPMQQGITLETFATDCTTPKSTYNVQDSNRTVCAKFTGALP